MKETTLEHVINSLKDTHCDGRFTKTFARPIGADCWEVLAKCKNIATVYHYSIEVLDKDALLAELSGINKQSEETPTDPINPTHYNGTQTLDRMIAVFGVDAVISFCEINAFKYRMRAGKKDGNPIEQDIKKALWYEGKANELKRKDNE